ncbi:hypothetical protein PYCCODRAFT_1409114 [Trametes coccinea BRFM310]|uniref:DNA polymerase n=1 Tax=Trametes coccinea (strain BRFM310) TaxID=1353009 RepID=A0A1Y2IQP8_TRAC3|nr:hypothetical protein PYCCODRAFT_1409114 [Trametes coccinea BRFM310]
MSVGSQPPSLRVRINQIDYTVVPPGLLDNSSLHRVPIIRIYGDSSAGLKTCVHIHQVYPYFFVEYLGKMHPDTVNQYIAKLKHSLNHAIAISLKRNPQSPKSKFVRAIVLVKGVHFYGFHANYSPFLKVHIADPAFVNRAVTIMQSGTVMQTRFRVYESHISYLLQFLCDFGLYGCGWIDLGEVWQRGQDEVSEDGAQDPELAQLLSTFKASPYYRQTRMPLEVDAIAPHILNRQKLSARNIHHKLTIPAPPFPPEPLVLSVRELWEDERQRRMAKGLSPSPEVPKDLSANSRGPGGGWVAEARWWEEIRKRIERERGREVTPPRMSWEKWVMTTFESIEALWEDEHKAWRPNLGGDGGSPSTGDQSSEDVQNPYRASAMTVLQNDDNHDVQHDDVEIDVDETMLSSQAMTQLMEHEEAEWQNNVQDNQEDDIDEHAQEFEEEFVEDGPPPDLQSVVGEDDDGAHNPFHDNDAGHTSTTPSPSKATNPFKAIWSRVSTSSRHRSTSIASNGPRTPTKPHRATPGWYTPTKRHDIRSPTVTPTKRPYSRIANKEAPGVGSSIRSPRSIFHPLPPANAEETVPADALPAPLETEESDTAAPEERPAKRRRLSPPYQDKSGTSGNSHTTSCGFSQPSSSSRKPNSQQKAMACSSITLYHGRNVYIYSPAPPTSAELLEGTDVVGIPSKVYRDPYYSKESDAPERPREYAGLVFHLKGGEGIATLEEWQSDTSAPPVISRPPGKLIPSGVNGWEYASVPPSVKQARNWLREQASRRDSQTVRAKGSSQIQGPTQLNPYGLKSTLVPRSDKVKREKQNMSVFAMEMFAPSRGDHVPDPDEDEVMVIFYALHSSDQDATANEGSFACYSGIIAVGSDQLNARRLRNVKAEFVDNELDLINRLIDIVLELDPDILSGWEVQASSWGYLAARGRSYGLDLGEQISRAPGRHMGGGSDQWGMKTTSTFKVTGRHVLNVWRIMRSEHTFSIYTFENVVFQILRRRTPWYRPQTLNDWFFSPVPEHTDRLLCYYARRTAMVLEILDVAEVVTKNAEFARVFGVDFFSVLSRGSQFKVESFMFRIAKPESFVLLSPSKQDVGKQNAAECMPLIMEPLSAFYNSPLVVLDFQSLYPSIMIAYNYCYSTCLGRITDFKGQYKFGVTDLRQPAGLLATLQDHINVAPNGIMYVKETVRKGLLGRMLTELLDTRVMVKQAMKGAKDDRALRRILDARQLGLKFIANVTYGYTSATYSGRMPAVEIADSIVQSGRETLEKAIRVINSTKKWGARVVYGDTDSLFIYLPGKTKEQAFRIGQDMADTVTQMNPAPVKLKFEKVYLPCVLMAKKRYVGFKFENPDDKEPGFDAKGIETVRRDGIPAQQKMTETCLKILFRTQDLSQVKDYCCRTWSRILENKVSIQDFIFAKEVKMGTYSDRVPPPPGVTVAARRMLEDPNDEPQYGERIPYVIVRGESGSRLVDRAIAPHELFRDSHKRLDAHYYISRVLVPPLERIFNLVGADVRSWYEEMPKSLRADHPDITLSPRKNKKSAMLANAYKIDDHFISSHCLICGALTPEVLCEVCRSDHAVTISELLSRVQTTESRLKDVHSVCNSCSGVAPAEAAQCESLDCPWLYERKKLETKADALATVHELIEEVEQEWYAERGYDLNDDTLDDWDVTVVA